MCTFDGGEQVKNNKMNYFRRNSSLAAEITFIHLLIIARATKKNRTQQKFKWNRINDEKKYISNFYGINKDVICYSFFAQKMERNDSCVVALVIKIQLEELSFCQPANNTKKTSQSKKVKHKCRN